MLHNARIAETGKRRVVIIGGGFGGLELAKTLNEVDVQVILIDKHNFHTFQPLLYQVATSGIEPSSIAQPFRELFELQKNLYYRMAEALSVDTEKQVVETSIGLVHYDYLVIATGATTNFYNNREIEQKAIPMKDIQDAITLRNTVLSNFEKALQIGEEEQLNSLMDYVIVGGGATGVELAGALSELRKHVFPKDYPELNFKYMDIHLIQSGPQLLKGMSEKASVKALQYLENFGVKVWLNRRVKSYDGYTVMLDTGEQIISRTMIWAAGVTGATIEGIREESWLGGRLKVNENNQVEGYFNIFGIGDIAAMITEQYPYGHPMMAQPAIQQGKLLGKNLKRLLNNEPVEAFRYHDQGAMATIGRNHAVADLKLFSREYRTQGFFAWLIWMFIHLISIIGFKNQLTVFMSWLWSYLNFNQGIRLIMGDIKEHKPVEEVTSKKLV
ncbi:NAD(P)/FAD-dependent oxidoreductase [Telluribacter sp.]|jgi:NADH dehydrogenase|uniref:NAD(P)/FAD-dependent oxidoreductase n=1 Tax=Telluribacter sp. TaxID=1978767 RepID=UPI002E1011F1|nr:NAD(P)/FAD-dependent oxidoreductase [Telluribacter sp.]